MNISVQTIVIYLLYFSRFLVTSVGHLPHVKAFFLLISLCFYSLLCFEMLESKQELLTFDESPQSPLLDVISDIFALTVVVCILDLPALIIHKYLLFIKTDIVIGTILCIINHILFKVGR